MSDVIGFLFGIVCGSSLAVILFTGCLPEKHDEKKNSKPVVINPYPNAVFLGYQPTGSLNTSNPPRGGSGYPTKYPIITRPEPIPYENEDRHQDGYV